MSMSNVQDASATDVDYPNSGDIPSHLLKIALSPNLLSIVIISLVVGNCDV
jgi:hypothetical protein